MTGIKDIKVRVRDFVVSTDGLFFASTDYIHPEGWAIAFLRYVPDEEGDREKDGIRYSKVGSDEAYAYLRENHPEYLFKSDVFNAELVGVPYEKIDRIIKPEERLAELREQYIPIIKEKRQNNEDLTFMEELMEKLIDLSDFFHYVAGVDYGNLGISGSILPGLQKPGTSDLDFVVYGLENHRNAIQAYKSNKDKEVYIDELGKSITLSKINDDFWDFVFNKRIKDDSLSKAEFAWYEERKSNRGLIRDTLFDILATRNYDEIEGSWGDTIYEPVDFATINCKIVSALGSFDNPATYTIEDLDVIEGPDVEISELASRTHTYAGEVVDGEEVVARGLVEKVMKNGEFEKYRLLVGTTRESINEYIKLRESPVVDRTINQWFVILFNKLALLFFFIFY